ncbi:hypothetical protein DFS34DRAFT_615167 [Phlyctochytrium arcticum]|nr:hypothetical protein DFS34DRAFT_615167 [Phlyctochytrium arcticum]
MLTLPKLWPTGGCPSHRNRKVKVTVRSESHLTVVFSMLVSQLGIRLPATQWPMEGVNDDEFDDELDYDLALDNLLTTVEAEFNSQSVLGETGSQFDLQSEAVGNILSEKGSTHTRAQNAFIPHELESLRREKLIRDGEISIIRSGLSKAESEALHAQERQALQADYDKQLRNARTELLFLVLCSAQPAATCLVPLTPGSAAK